MSGAPISFDPATAPGSVVYAEVLNFLYEEAALLDEGKFEPWLSLFAPDIRYWMPVRTTRFVAAGDGFEEVSFFEENLASLTTRVKRLATESAWAETPPSRTRHYVSNLRLRPAETAGEIVALTNFFVTRTRADHGHQLFTGAREDVLRRAEGGFTIARRKILVDQTVITNTNLSVLF